MKISTLKPGFTKIGWFPYLSIAQFTWSIQNLTRNFSLKFTNVSSLSLFIPVTLVYFMFWVVFTSPESPNVTTNSTPMPFDWTKNLVHFSLSPSLSLSPYLIYSSTRLLAIKLVSKLGFLKNLRIWTGHVNRLPIRYGVILLILDWLWNFPWKSKNWPGCVDQNDLWCVVIWDSFSVNNVEWRPRSNMLRPWSVRHPSCRPEK